MKKTPFSTRIYTLAALALTAVAAVLLIILALIDFASPWHYVFCSVIAAVAAVGIFLGIKERLRGRYLLAVIAIALGASDVIALVIFAGWIW